jgi:hypothetical protein
VLVTEDLIDREYIEKYTLGSTKLQKILPKYTPAVGRRIPAALQCRRSCSSRATTARQAGRDPPQLRHAAPRRRRHRRAHHRLPAGAHRRLARSAGGILLTTADNYNFDHAKLERPDLMPRNKRRA